ncbi:unnamed protein product [Brassica rapa subsp. narinosa]
MPTFRMNPNLELQEFTQPLLKKKKSSPSSVTSIITYNKDIHYEKNVVTMVGKTFDQLVSNCPDNVHLEVSKTKRPLC